MKMWAHLIVILWVIITLFYQFQKIPDQVRDDPFVVEHR